MQIKEMQTITTRNKDANSEFLHVMGGFVKKGVVVL